MKSVVRVTPRENYQLIIEFSSGEVRLFDVRPYLDKGVFSQLKDRTLFARAFVALNTVCWPNELDIAPETLYICSVPISMAVHGQPEETKNGPFSNASNREAMRDTLINATEAAIYAVNVTRFFQTERGYHGQFYCALQHQLEQAGLMTNGAILEMEYQKSRRHDTSQRPDIVFHIPTENSSATVRENNFAVWALKRKASENDAKSDFALLDDMFETLCYPFGFFVNIDSTDSMQQYYTGAHPDRLVAVAAQLIGAQVNVRLGRPR